jgi:hypothetical protein
MYADRSEDSSICLGISKISKELSEINRMQIYLTQLRQRERERDTDRKIEEIDREREREGNSRLRRRLSQGHTHLIC